jgi:transcriptional regulator with XRE-family HTH domain
MSNIFSKNLKYLRKLNQLTQEGLAFNLGTKRATVGAWEEGRGEPNYSMLVNIASLFEHTIDCILRDDLEKGFNEVDWDLVFKSEAKLNLDFINKRIKEQSEYLAMIRVWMLRRIITESRYTDLYDSATAQLKYFAQKKEEHEDKK